MKKPAKGARGVALITALLVVALATLAATAVLASANASLHRTASLRDSEQAWWYARGVESWILAILADDSKRSPDHDGFDEAWAQPVDYLPVDEGFVRGQIVDLQGEFNLNNLAPPARGGAPAADAAANALSDLYGRQFQRLVDICGCLDNGVTSGSVLRAVRDWMTDARLGGGADTDKDAYYLSLTPPYRAGLRRFSHPSELLAVQGVNAKLYRSLRPLVTALPLATPTLINVNTAPAQLLRVACDSIDDGKLAQWVKRVQDDKQPEKDPGAADAFVSTTGCGFSTSMSSAKVFSGKTNFFQVRGEVFVGSGRLALYSLVYRPDNGTPTVVARDVD